MMQDDPARVRELESAVSAVLGDRRRLRSAARLRGGSKKGVYRLTFASGPAVIAYVWDPAENFWPSDDGSTTSGSGPFSEASGAGLFQASHACLTSLGVRTPDVYSIDLSRRFYPADFALVEDISGPSLEAQITRDPAAAEVALGELREMLQTLAACQSSSIGKVAHVRIGATESRPCAAIVLERALEHLEWAAQRERRLSRAQGALRVALEPLATIQPRSRHGLVHGELGPDHVLIDCHGSPVLIDIEGLMFFDSEWEHAFLRLRFGAHYPLLRATELDEQRLQLYSLALYLSLVAGPLRLLDGDFPDRAPMRAIIERNIERALDQAPIL